MVVQISQDTARIRTSGQTGGSVLRARRNPKGGTTGLRSAWLAITLASVVVLAGCTEEPTSPPASPSSSSSSATNSPSETGSDEPSPTSPPPAKALADGEHHVLAQGLAAPWSVVEITNPSTTETSYLISLRDSGQILHIAEDGTTQTLTTLPGVVHTSEDGLLGLAYHQDFGLYAYFSTAQDNRIVSMDLTWDAAGPQLSEPQTILTGIEHAATHNGGRIAFGPDNKLYATTGDAREDLSFRGPADTVRMLGKILRLNPDGTRPQDNPFTGSLVWSLGHRNVQGIAWAADGTMYASEFGQDTFDELNVIEKGGNYGWPEVEGIANNSNYIDPIAQWDTSDASPSGIAIVNNRVYLANLRGQILRWVDLADPTIQGEQLPASFGRIRDVILSSSGTLLVLTNNTDGRGDPQPQDDQLLEVGLGN